MDVRPLRFGPLEIRFPVIQAALSGYSDGPMRTMARRFGAEFTLCEVMLDQFVVSVSKRKSRFYFTGTDEHPCGAQLMGCEPEQFVRAAARLVGEGFDLIDVNFACPVRKVLGRGRGGYMMSDPDAARVVLQRLRRELPEEIPLTVKLRKGFDDGPESRERFFRILDDAVQAGVCGVTLHGRTVRQRYEGESDWNFIAEVKRYLADRGHTGVTLVGSGDLFTAEICRRRLRESGVDGLALARGVIGNPWLFREVAAVLEGRKKPAPPTLAEQAEVLAEHFRLSAELYGEKRAATAMRAFGVKYAQLHPDSLSVRQAFVRVKSTPDWQHVLEEFYLPAK